MPGIRQSAARNSRKPGAAPRNKRGRPAKITAAVVERVAEMMSYGLTEEDACLVEGVNPATFGPAVSRSEAFQRIVKVHHARFKLRLGKACVNGGEWVPVLDRDGQPVFDERGVQEMRHVGWQGMMTLAERRYKPYYNRTDTHALTNAEGEGGGEGIPLAVMLKLEEAMKADVRKQIEKEGK